MPNMSSTPVGLGGPARARRVDSEARLRRALKRTGAGITDLDRPGPRIALGVLGLVIVVALWQLSITVGIVSALDVAPPKEVAEELRSLVTTGELWTDIGHTLSNAAIGIAIAVAIAIPVGIAMGMVPAVRAALGPVVEALRPVPGIAFAPLAIVIWGPASGSTIFLVVFSCVFPLIVQTLHGVRAVDPVALMTAQSFRLTKAQRVMWIVTPGSLPYIATGLRVAGSVALIAAVGGELIIGTPGLGSAIHSAQIALDIGKMYALIIVSGLLGIVIYGVLAALEKRALAWHSAQIREVR